MNPKDTSQATPAAEGSQQGPADLAAASANLRRDLEEIHLDDSDEGSNGHGSMRRDLDGTDPSQDAASRQDSDSSGLSSTWSKLPPPSPRQQTLDLDEGPMQKSHRGRLSDEAAEQERDRTMASASGEPEGSDPASSLRVNLGGEEAELGDDLLQLKEAEEMLPSSAEEDQMEVKDFAGGLSATNPQPGVGPLVGSEDNQNGSSEAFSSSMEVGNEANPQSAGADEPNIFQGPGDQLLDMGMADAQPPLQHQQEAASGTSDTESATAAVTAAAAGGSPSMQPDAASGQTAQMRGVESGNLAEQFRSMAGEPLRASNGLKMRLRQYAFPAHADADSFSREIDEFYSYVEAPQVLENKAAWQEYSAQDGRASPIEADDSGQPSVSQDASQKALPANWTSLPTSTRQRYIRCLLTDISSKDPDRRITSSRALLYLLQGNFGDTDGPQHQGSWIKLNAKMARSQSAIGRVFASLKRAMWKHDFLSSLPDNIMDSSRHDDGAGNPPPALLTPQSKAEYMDEVNLELTLCLAQLYLLIETGRRDEEEGGDAVAEDAEHSVTRLSDDLMALNPPLPIFLFNVLAALRDKNAKGFPVKKLLLCLWKGLLACLGGQKDIERCKALARRVEGLHLNPTSGMASNTMWPPQSFTGASDHGMSPNMSRHGQGSQEYSSGVDLNQRLELGKPRKRRPTKATPRDFETFRGELAAKYPTYSARSINVPLDKLSTATDPLPPRRLATNRNGEAESTSNAPNSDALPQPGTPAPSPPQSPRPNKQKFQTDQTKPFVFPYSNGVQGERLVPYSIEEADRLYRDNMHVSTELWQMWKTKEEMEREERGLLASDPIRAAAQTPKAGSEWAKSKPASTVSNTSVAPTRSNSHDGRSCPSLSALSKLGDVPSQSRFAQPPIQAQSDSPSFTPDYGSPRFDGMSMSDVEGASSQGGPTDPDNSFLTRGEPTYDRLLEVEKEIAATLQRCESDHLLAVVDNARYLRNLTALHQQLADVRRLQRVDIIYRGILPSMQSAVIVLLKLLLATVTAQTNSNSPQAQYLQDPSMEETPPPTVEDIDILRHREITTKAISAILLLLLKWFKASHVLKFHHLSQFLVDSNCMLLVLKMFGLQEVANSVRANNEVPSFNFFVYCNTQGSDTQERRDSASSYLDSQEREGRHGTTDAGFDGNRSSPSARGSVSGAADVDLIHEYSFRNFMSVMNFTRILQKLTKRRVHRILLLTNYKSSAILKRLLKVQHPTLQLYILKLIKSQVPFCGRKWRQSNMKVITGIYLNCRPDLRDEWLSSDVEDVVMDSLSQEQALRALVKFYVMHRFGDGADTHQQEIESQQQQQQQQGRVGRAPLGHGHSKSFSATDVGASGELESPFAAEGRGAEEIEGGPNVQGTAVGSTQGNYDFFDSEFLLPPPRRGPTFGGPAAAAYIPDDVVDGYLGEYEEILGEIFGPAEDQIGKGTNDAASGASGDAQTGVSPSPVGSFGSSPGSSPSGSMRESDLSRISPHLSPSQSPQNGPVRAQGGGGAWPNTPAWGLSQPTARSAWDALGEILGDGGAGSGGDGADGQISDSESIASIGELDFSHPNNAQGASSSVGGGLNDTFGEEGRDSQVDRTRLGAPAMEEEGKSDWEHLSPKEMRFLASQPRPPTPGSPTSGRLRRRSSSSSSSSSSSRSADSSLAGLGAGIRRSSGELRPVLNFDDEDISNSGEVEEIGDEGEAEVEGEEDLQELPKPQSGGIDEVEHIFGQ